MHLPYVQLICQAGGKAGKQEQEGLRISQDSAA